jgi:hypothetical protein
MTLSLEKSNVVLAPSIYDKTARMYPAASTLRHPTNLALSRVRGGETPCRCCYNRDRALDLEDRVEVLLK